MNQSYLQLRTALTERYSEGEARAIAFSLFEDAFGVSRTDIYADKVRQFSEDERQRFDFMCQELLQGIPLQQVVGFALFCGHRFRVTPDVLIPRPETEELVAWALQTAAQMPQSTPLRLLDAGTGSGCIAISLKLALPSAVVDALDVSVAALGVARQNATALGAEVNFAVDDLLQPLPVNAQRRYHLIVSNPPYICQREAAEMEEQVLAHEPHTALFVPDADPQLFYRALAQRAKATLVPGGALLVEGNRAYVHQTAELFSQMGFERVEVRNDDFGNARMVRAFKG